METLQELQKINLEELKKRLLEEKKNLHNLKMAHAIDALKNPMQIRKTRKHIARINTILHTKKSNPEK